MAESPYSISAVLSVGYANASVATWNSSTPLNTAAVIVSNDYSYNTLNISLAQTTTITGGQVTFQGSYDGANWFPMQGFTPGTFAAVGPTYNLVANTYAIFQFNLTGVPYFQIVLSSALLGTGAVTIGYAADSFVNTMASAQAGTWTVGVSGTVAVTQSTSPWVVSNSGIFAVQAAQSGTWTVQQGGAPWSVSQSGAWTVSATQGTSPWVVSLASTTITGTVAVTQSTSPWVVSGTVTANQGGAPWSQNLTQLNSVALGSPSNFGTSPGAISVQGVNASMFSGTTALTNTGGSLNVNITGGSSSGTQYTEGTTVATPIGTAALGKNPSNVVETLRLDASNNLLVDLSTALPAGVNTIGAVTQASGPWTINETQLAGTTLGAPSAYGTSPGAVTVQGVNAFVTNNVGVTQITSPWVVSLVSTTITGTVAVTQSTTPWTVQGDSASGAAKAGNPIQIGGVFNTTQPTVTTGQTVEAQMTARGAQIVATGVDAFNVANTGTFAVQAAQSGTWTVQQGGAPWSINETQIAGTALGAPTAWGTAPATSIVVQGVNAELFVGQNAVSATAPVPVSATAAANTSGNPIFVSAAVTGTVAVTQSTSPWVVSGTVTANQGGAPWSINETQLNGVALGSPSNYGTSPGAVSVQGVNAFVTNVPAVSQSGTWTVQQGTPPWSVSQSGAWNVNQTIGIAGFGKVTDGTNTAAVKPASTQPATTDPALVVTLSPNSGTITVSTTQGSQATYRVASGTVSANIVTPSFVPHAGVLFQLQGSATKIVNVLHFSLSASGASAGYIDVSMQRTSAAASGGTAVTPIVAPADTTDPAATAVAKYYTAAPTPGTFVANLLSERFFFPQAPYTSTYLDFTFGDIPGTKAVTLRGTSDFFTVQLAGAIPSTPVMDFYCVWTEA